MPGLPWVLWNAPGRAGCLPWTFPSMLCPTGGSWKQSTGARRWKNLVLFLALCFQSRNQAQPQQPERLFLHRPEIKPCFKEELPSVPGPGRGGEGSPGDRRVALSGTATSLERAKGFAHLGQVPGEKLGLAWAQGGCVCLGLGTLRGHSRGH